MSIMEQKDCLIESGEKSILIEIILFNRIIFMGGGGSKGPSAAEVKAK